MSEPCTVHNQKIRRARKLRRCQECGGQIEQGERYHYHSGVCDGRGFSFGTCTDCEAMRNALNRDVDYDDMVAFSDLLQSVADSNDRNKIATMLATIIRRKSCFVKTIDDFTNLLCEIAEADATP